MAQQTYYDLLGVSQNATTEEIRSAFASKYRSFQVLVGDPNPEKAEYAQRMLRWLQDANTMLSDPEKRRQYDAQVQAQIRAEQERQRKLREQQALAEHQRKQQMQQVISSEVQKREQVIRDASNKEIEAVRQQKGVGNIFWSLFAGPMLGSFCCGLILFRDFGDALWLGILSVLMGLSALTGIIPCGGQYAHYYLLNNQIFPWWTSVSGIEGHWIITIWVVFSYIQNVAMSIGVVGAIIAIIASIRES